MNFNWWHKILEERREKKVQEEFNRGFSWALVAYYIEKKEPKEIKSLSEGTFNDYTHFDEGAGVAILLIEHHRVLGILQGEHIDRHRSF